MGNLSMKFWDEFATPGAPDLGLIFAFCDNAAGEVCCHLPAGPSEKPAIMIPGRSTLRHCLRVLPGRADMGCHHRSRRRSNRRASASRLSDMLGNRRNIGMHRSASSRWFARRISGRSTSIAG